MGKGSRIDISEGDGDPRYFLPPHENGKPLVLTQARKERGDVARVETDRGGREYRSLAHPLEYLVARRWIEGRQYEAGCRLAELWAFGAQSPYAQGRYELTDGGEPCYTPLGMAARQYRAALSAVPSRPAQRVVHLVCCFGCAPSELFPELSGRSAKRHGMRLLKDGLDRLADYFRMPV